MAQKYITVKTSDLSGAELESGEGDTINFTVGRNSYIIDLTDKEVGEFYDVLKPYVDAARKADSTPARSSSSDGKAPKRSDLAEVREWANRNGYTVSARGRIPANVIEAFDAR